MSLFASISASANMSMRRAQLSLVSTSSRFNSRVGTSSRRNFSSTKKPMTQEERNEAIREANETMKGYVETRILAKQGKLKSRRKQSEQTKSENAIQLSLLVSLAIAFIASPFLGKKIAQDHEFREKYVPSWFDFTVKAPSSAWTRQELHQQVMNVEQELRERAIAGDFSPEKLAEMKQKMEPRQDLTDEDRALAAKYGWGRIHPGIDPDDDDYDDDEE